MWRMSTEGSILVFHGNNLCKKINRICNFSCGMFLKITILILRLLLIFKNCMLLMNLLGPRKRLTLKYRRRDVCRLRRYQGFFGKTE